MSEVNKEFIEFGNKMFILFILAIISAVAGFIGWAVPAVGFINLILVIVYFVFLILARGHIINANNSLNNEDLESFCKRIIVAIVTSIIGLFFFTIAMVLFQTNAWILGIPIVIVAIILLIIALIFDILAWSDMKGFFRDNKSMFPEDKAKNAETGSLLMMLGALPLVGFILRIIGSYFLSQLKDLE
ncbi:MAG: hypothetical protein ACFFDN_31175 [Candidatus Hodarchaeota archaeon]